MEFSTSGSWTSQCVKLADVCGDKVLRARSPNFFDEKVWKLVFPSDFEARRRMAQPFLDKSFRYNFQFSWISAPITISNFEGSCIFNKYSTSESYFAYCVVPDCAHRCALINRMYLPPKNISNLQALPCGWKYFSRILLLNSDLTIMAQDRCPTWGVIANTLCPSPVLCI